MPRCAGAHGCAGGALGLISCAGAAAGHRNRTAARHQIMEPAIARGPSSVAFEDGLGTRHHTVDVAGEHLEIFALREELTLIASFDFALRERVSRLANFRHACYGHVRGVSRLDPTT